MTSEPFTLRWGILATGNIAKTFTKDLLIPTSTRNASDIHHIVAAAGSSTSQSRAAEFLKEVGAPQSATPHGSYAALVRDPDVDIIYIATPHSHHYQHAHLALSAGKHVLIEKPLTVNAAQAHALFALAAQRNRFLMEAMWTRFLPLTLSIQDFIASGHLGMIKRVHADLSYWNDVEAEFGTEHRMVNMALAGGALLDLGVYSLAWVFLTLYHLQRGSKRKPSVKAAMSLYDATGCDEMSSVLLDFPGAHVGSQDSPPQDSPPHDSPPQAPPPHQSEKCRNTEPPNGDAHALALTNLRVPASPSNRTILIQGSLGSITIPFPPYRPLSYTLHPHTSAARGTLASFPLTTKTFPVPGGGQGMFFEADECARCIRDGKRESGVLGWEETGVVMEVLDEVRAQGGLRYSGGLESVEMGLEGSLGG